MAITFGAVSQRSDIVSGDLISRSARNVYPIDASREHIHFTRGRSTDGRMRAICQHNAVTHDAQCDHSARVRPNVITDNFVALGTGRINVNARAAVGIAIPRYHVPVRRRRTANRIVGTVHEYSRTVVWAGKGDRAGGIGADVVSGDDVAAILLQINAVEVEPIDSESSNRAGPGGNVQAGG